MIPFFRPEALEIWGPIKIQPWGVLVASGFVLGTLVCQRYARARGEDPRHYSDIVVWLAAGGIFFSHMGHALLYEPARYLAKPWELLYIWEGLSSIGGIAGCTVVAIVFFRRRNLDVLKFGDLLMLGLTFGWFIGRMGCFVVHDHIGCAVVDAPAWLQSTLGWLSVDFPQEYTRVAIRSPNGTFLRWDNLPTLRFDQGLMDSLLAGVIFCVLVALAYKPKLPGVVFAATPLLYAPGRFALDFLRNEDLGQADTRYFGLTPAQYGAMVMFAGGIFLIFRIRRRTTPWPEPGTKPWVDPTEQPASSR